MRLVNCRYEVNLDPLYQAVWSEYVEPKEILAVLPPWLTLSLSRKERAFIAVDESKGSAVWWLRAPVQGSVCGQYKCLGHGRLEWLGYGLYPVRQDVGRYRMLDDNRMLVYSAVSRASQEAGELGYAYLVALDRDQSKINPDLVSSGL